MGALNDFLIEVKEAVNGLISKSDALIDHFWNFARKKTINPFYLRATLQNENKKDPKKLIQQSIFSTSVKQENGKPLRS